MAAVLVANKCDLDSRRTVSPKVGQEFAESNGMEYFEVSAVSRRLQSDTLVISVLPLWILQKKHKNL